MEAGEEQLREFLLDSGLVSRRELERAAGRASERGESLSQALLESGVLSEEEIRRAASHALGISYVVLTKDNIDPEALLLIPEPLCRARGLVAFGRQERGIEVALLDIAELSALDFLKARVRILPRLTSRESLRQALFIYQKQLKDKFDGTAQALLAHALSQGTSSIHLEDSGSGARVRYRLGGVLHEAMSLSAHSGARLVAEIKALAGVQKTGTLSPEVRIKLTSPEPLSLRLSFIPTVGGEKVVLHITKEREGRKGYTLHSLGLHGSTLEHLEHALYKKSGLILLIGPKGSGVSTALYTLLDLLNHPTRSLASIERHIEHHLPQIAQLQIQEEQGLSAAAALRAALKTDPDVVALHDAQEESTVELAASASKRALVLVGLHDSAIAPQSAVGATILQLRLVRRLCSECSVEHTLSRSESRALEAQADIGHVLAALKEEEVVGKQAAWKDIVFLRGEGCGACEGGYLPAQSGRGFLGVQALQAPAGASLTVIEDALFKAAQGLTSIEEVVRLAGLEGA